jgi:hypothetical protein
MKQALIKGAKSDEWYTQEQFASALTVVIGGEILKPKVTVDSYCIMIEYNVKNGRKTWRLRQVIPKMTMQNFNGTMETFLGNVMEQMKYLLATKGELNYDE